MENIDELTKEINEIIKRTESGSMDLKEARYTNRIHLQRLNCVVGT